MKPLIKSLIVLLIIIFVIMVIILYSLKTEIYERKITSLLRNLEKENGLVLNIWVSDEKFLDKLKDNKIKYLFVDVGDTNSKGSLTTSNEDIQSFLELVRVYEKNNNYNFILLPYSEINTYTYDIASKDFQRNFIKDYKSLINLGFDGVYVDIEPVQFNHRKLYLKFLESLHKEIPQDSILSVYSGSLGDSDNEWEWNLDFYQEVSNRVNLIFVPGYDINIEDEDEYSNYMKSQILQLSSRNLNSYFILGVPTHKKNPENINNALKAYKEATNNNPDNKFIGVAIFSEWTIQDRDWKIYEKIMVE